ncbi:hypothetical protein R5R35_000662 [Gryllus longicercus]|uniref:UDP-glucuronosyltransferase n=1 Tax=Gryllus longicercus TaxID=2509291 RepID=A0AAN9VUD1_9ORTH
MGANGLWLWAVAATLLLLGGGGSGGVSGVEAGRVLSIFYFSGRSHFLVIETLLKELAKRGHQVDVVSHFPQKKPLPNYRDFSLAGSYPSMVNHWTFEQLQNFHFLKLMTWMWEENVEICRKVMEHPVMKQLAESREKYDVVLVEILGSDCTYGYAYKVGAPVIGITTLVGLPWGQDRVGNPDNPAYVPGALLPFTSQMSLWERTLNTLGQLYAVWGEKLRGRRLNDLLLREHLGADMPSLSELIERNTSLVMVNSHFSLNGARPAVPGYVEVGGMNVDPNPGPLPEPFRSFLDGAGAAGAVLVSFGSLVPGEKLPPKQLQAFLKVLGALPQRVVWRVNASRVPGGLPRNVIGSTWIPQQALLSHPNMRAFVTHGGLGGTHEAVHWGVPTVTIPFFSDQHQNGFLMQQHGAGRVLQFDDITEDSLRQALHAVLNDPSYRESAKRLSEQFRDRPQEPLETAVWWTEYVMRHRGAPHLRSAAVGLSWVQLWLLDVGAVLAAILAMLATILWATVSTFTNCLFSKAKDRASKTNKAKRK